MRLSEDIPTDRRPTTALPSQSDSVGIKRRLAAADCAAESVDLRAPQIGLVMPRERIEGHVLAPLRAMLRADRIQVRIIR